MTDLVVDGGANRAREGGITGRGVANRGRFDVEYVCQEVQTQLVEFSGVTPGLTCGAMKSSTLAASLQAARIRSKSAELVTKPMLT